MIYVQDAAGQAIWVSRVLPRRLSDLSHRCWQQIGGMDIEPSTKIMPAMYFFQWHLLYSWSTIFLASRCSINNRMRLLGFGLHTPRYFVAGLFMSRVDFRPAALHRAAKK